jgi:hypothetical protein
MAPVKSPVALRALRTSTSRPSGSASASAMTSTVSTVANGSRARRPSEDNSACR